MIDDIDENEDKEIMDVEEAHTKENNTTHKKPSPGDTTRVVSGKNYFVKYMYMIQFS